MMFSGVPNLAVSFGYVNASWTLRADLTCEYLCHVINHMHAHGQSMVTPTLRPHDADMQARCSCCCWSVRARMLTKRVQLKPWLDQLSSGYIKRASHKGPKQVRAMRAMLAMRTWRRLQFRCMLNRLRRGRGRGGTRRIILRTRSCSARSRLLPTACLCFADAEGGGRGVWLAVVLQYILCPPPTR